MATKAVIFDLDGTLLDTLDDLCDSVNHSLEKFGFPSRTIDEIREFVGNGSVKLMERAVPNGQENEMFTECYEYFVKYYREHSDIKTKPYEGIIELLDLLGAKGIGCAVVTNKPNAAAQLLCRGYFGDRLALTVGDRENIRRKPDPDSVLWVMEQLGCEKAVYVGDSDVDIITSRNAGIPCVSVTWGFRGRDFLAECGGTHFADSADQLREELFALLEYDSI